MNSSMSGISRAIGQNLANGSDSQINATQQKIASAIQFLNQQNIDTSDLSKAHMALLSSPVAQQGGYVPDPRAFAQEQSFRPTGLSTPSADQGWPKGTTTTQGGMIVVPSSDGSVRVFSPGASGPNDANKLEFTIKANQVFDNLGQATFDLRQGGIIKLTDGSVLSSALTPRGEAQINIISNNQRENISFGANGLSIQNSQDGSNFLQRQLGISSIQGNTYAVAPTDTGDVHFYKIQDGNILGRVTGTSWQPNPEKLSNLATSMISIINSSLGQKFDFNLNPQDYVSLIKDNDIGPLLQKLQSDISIKTDKVYNFSNLMPDSKITSPNQLKNLVDNMATDINQNSGKNPDVSSAMVQQMQNLVAKTPIGEDWGSKQATIDPNDKNYLVAPPQFTPTQGTPAYADALTQNLETLLSGSNLPPDVAKFILGQGTGDLQDPWAQQFAGGLYDPDSSLSDQLAPLSDMRNTLANYAALSKQVTG